MRQGWARPAPAVPKLPFTGYALLTRTRPTRAPAVSLYGAEMIIQAVAVASTLVVGGTLAAFAFFDGVFSDVTTHMKVAEDAAKQQVPPAWTKG